MRLTLILILLGINLGCFAQQPGKKNALFTVRGVIGIPRGISSAMFRTSFAGLYETNISTNLRVFNNFYAGVGYQNSHFKNNSFLKFTYFNASIPYNTRLIGNGVFVKLGYDQFFDKGYASYSLNTGYMRENYIHVNADTNIANKPFVGTTFYAPYLQPELAINFLADRSLTFSLILSYTTLFYKYDPKAPRFNQFADVNTASNRYFMGWINIGFGFNVLIK